MLYLVHNDAPRGCRLQGESGIRISCSDLGACGRGAQVQLMLWPHSPGVEAKRQLAVAAKPRQRVDLVLLILRRVVFLH